MRSRTTPAPPTSLEELLILLRRTRLLDHEQLRRLANSWKGDDPPQPQVEEMVRAGVITRYQAEQLLAGRAGRLRLGPYRLLERLGRGGMGLVFKAEHLLLRRLVALKVVGRARRRQPKDVPARRIEPGRTPVHRRRPTQLWHEAEMTARLSHPNIVVAHDACRLRGRLVLVLEYVEGVDLERLVAQTGPLPVTLAVEVVRQTAQALRYLHERQLVHRDVKPANLMLAHAAGPDGMPSVKLLDLGIASSTSHAGQELCGTPDYLAPERGLATDSTDIRSDLYSLGCTFYHLLTGRVPFPGGNWTGKLLRHRIEVPTPVADLRPEVPPRVLEILERLMARDPDERYQTPAEVVAAVDALPSAGQAVLLVPPATRERPSTRSTRRTRPALVAGLCMAAIAVGTGAGNVARKTLASPIVSTAAKPDASASSILRDPSYSGLPSAIDAADDGAIVEVPAGRHVLPPIHVTGKRLTLRAAAGAKPILVRASQQTWDALIQSDRDLTLEGLELHGGETEGPFAPLVSVEAGKLQLRSCALTQRCQAPALAVRRGTEVMIDKCTVTALVQGLAVEAPSQADCAIRLNASEFLLRDAAGPAILLWASEAESSRRIDVELTGSKVRAGRIVACRSLTAPVRLRATGNHLIFHQSLVSFDGFRDRETWHDRLSWHGARNRYETTGPWLRLEGRPGPAWDEQAFAKLWRGRP